MNGRSWLKIHAQKEQAIAALLTQRNVEEAARAAGIGTQTLLRWLNTPEFCKEYLKARRQVVQQTIARLQQATGASGTVALKLMTDPNVPAAVRLRAAEFVFDRAIKGIEIEDLDVRVAELERAEASRNKPLAWQEYDDYEKSLSTIGTTRSRTSAGRRFGRAENQADPYRRASRDFGVSRASADWAPTTTVAEEWWTR